MSGNQRRSASRSKGPNRRRRNKRGGGRDPRGKGFWGDSTQLPDGSATAEITADPAAVVRSLGRPPLSGHDVVAEHYFEAVYQSAVTLASALAAAGNLIEAADLTAEVDD